MYTFTKIILKSIITLVLLNLNNAYAGEKDLYDFLWLDPDKSVYVLQNKIYPKNKTYYADIGFVTSVTANFQSTNGAQFKFGYYWAEEWAVEFNFIQYGNENNAAFENVKIINEAEPFVRRPLRSTSVFAIWSPFYGKINTFNKIYYFDWSFGVGTGQYTMESSLDGNINNPLEKNQYDQENYIPVQLKTNLKFHINRNLHLGVELLNTNYQAGTPKNPSAKKWSYNNDVILSIGVSF